MQHASGGMVFRGSNVSPPDTYEEMNGICLGESQIVLRAGVWRELVLRSFQIDLFLPSKRNRSVEV